MFEDLFNLKKYTSTDLLNELLSNQFNESKIDKIYKSGVAVDWINANSENYLHLCAQKNKPSSIQWLLKKGLEIDLKTLNGQSPLFYAVQNGSLESTQLLISKGADIYLLDNNKRSLLQEAVKNGHIEITQLLLKYPLDINNIDQNGNSLLFDATSVMNPHLLEMVLNIPNINLNHKDLNGNTILFYDNVNIDTQLINKLIEKGIDLSIKNKEGKDYIFFALENHMLNQEVLQNALTLGYDINKQCNGQNLLMILLEQMAPDSDLIHFLLSKNIKLDLLDSNEENILFKTVRRNDIHNTRLFLEKKAININHKNSEGNTILVYATLSGSSSMNMILELLKYGANPNIADNNGATLVEKLIDIILHTNRRKKISSDLIKEINKEDDYLEIFKKILLNSKVFLRKLNSNGKPLFFDTVFYSHNILLRLLQNYGADINHKDSEGRNILHNLLTMSESPIFKDQKGFNKLLHELIFYGADVNSKDEEGATTAHRAILHTNEHTLKVILDSKANTKAVDKQGRSLVHNCVWDSKMKHFKLIHNYNESILNMPDSHGILPINYAAFIGHTDLVLEMITARAHVNNPHEKSEKMVKFFRKFYQNVYNLNQNVRDEFERKNIKMLITNMKKEFDLQEV